MSSIPEPNRNGGPDTPLILLRDGQRREILPAQLSDEQARRQVVDLCATTSNPVFVIGGLLDWDDGDRWNIVRLIASIPNVHVRIAEDTPDTDLFAAVLALMADDSDVERCGRGRRGAIQAAALIHAGDVESAASRIARRLRELDVHGARADSIASELRELVASQRRVADPDQRQTLRVHDILPDAPISRAATTPTTGEFDSAIEPSASVAAVIVPTGWQLDAAGITRLDDQEPRQIMPVPVVMIRRLLNIDDGSESVEIAWPRDNRWKTTIVNRATIATTRTIVELASAGLPVTSNNAADLIQFLHDYESQNIELLPVGRVTGRLGWVGPGGSHGFLWGRTLLNDPAGAVQASDEIVFTGADQGEEQIADGFFAAGTFDGWQRAITLVRSYPRARLGLYASLSPPLLEIVGAANFALSYDGPTSLGKTSELRVCASPWGCTDERSSQSILHSWDATRVGLEGAAAVQNALPLLADDTKRARQKDVVSQLLYDLTAGRERERGSPTGLRRSRAWRTVLISTGEVPITSFFEDTGGTRGRVLPVWGSPFGQADAATGQIVNALNVGLLENFGHAGPRFVQFLIHHRDRWESWKAHYRRLCDRLRQRAGDDPVARRLAEHLAVIRMAAILGHHAGIFPWRYRDVTAELWAELTAEAPAADRGRAALEYAISWAHAHPVEFFSGVHAAGAPLCGWAGRWDVGRLNHGIWDWLGFFPYKLNAILTDGGFDPEATIRTWQDRGWLRVDRDGRRQYRTSIDGHSTRLIAIERTAIAEVIGMADERVVVERVRLVAPTGREIGNSVGSL